MKEFFLDFWELVKSLCTWFIHLANAESINPFGLVD